MKKLSLDVLKSKSVDLNVLSKVTGGTKTFCHCCVVTKTDSNGGCTKTTICTN